MKSGFKKAVLIGLIAGIYGLSPVFSYDYFYAGKVAYYRADYETANKHLREAVVNNPLNVNYRYYYAQSLIKSNRIKAAQEEYVRIIEISPKSEAARLASIGLAKLYTYKIQRNREALNYGYKGQSSSSIDYVGDNYITNAVNNQGKVIRWDTKKMPLKVYFDASGAKSSYVEAVKGAFSTWSSSLAGIISYKTLKEKENADIIVKFTPTISVDKNNTGFVAGLASPNTRNNQLNFVDLKFTTHKPNNMPVSEIELYNVALHEIGHALGIWGHSEKDTDIMYPKANSVTAKAQLSKRDVNTVKLLYKLDAEVSNADLVNANKQSGKNDVLLGNNTVRVDKKLKEALDYVKEIPNQPIGWINLGQVYLNKKQYQESIASFKKALSIDAKSKDAMIGLIMVYKEMGKMPEVFLQFQKLIALDPGNIGYSHDLAIMYLKEGKKEEAKKVIDTLISNNPKAKNDENIVKLLQRIEAPEITNKNI